MRLLYRPYTGDVGLNATLSRVRFTGYSLGITTVTEDVATQKVLISSVFDDEFQTIIRTATNDQQLLDQTISYSQRYLDNQVRKLNTTMKTMKDELHTLKEQMKQSEGDVAATHQTNNRNQEIIERQELQINKLAEERVHGKYIFKWFILPYSCLIIALVVVLIFLSLLFDIKWLSAHIKQLELLYSATPLAKSMGDPCTQIYVILCGLFLACSQQFVRRLGQIKRKKDHDKMIAEHIEFSNH